MRETDDSSTMNNGRTPYQARQEVARTLTRGEFSSVHLYSFDPPTSTQPQSQGQTSSLCDKPLSGTRLIWGDPNADGTAGRKNRHHASKYLDLTEEPEP